VNLFAHSNINRSQGEEAAGPGKPDDFFPDLLIYDFQNR